MKSKIPLVVRVLLGLLFVMSGVVGLLNLYPTPPDLPENLLLFNKGMMAAKYFFPLLKSTEILCGLALISGFFVPLALVVLAPIVLNIFMVHAFIARDGLPLAIIIGLALVYLSFFAEPYSKVVKSLFKMR